MVPKISNIVVELHVLHLVAGEYVNFVNVAFWNETFAILVALVVFVSTLKFIKFLKFNRRVNALAQTIKFAAKDLKSFCVIFFVYFFAFAQV